MRVDPDNRRLHQLGESCMFVERAWRSQGQKIIRRLVRLNCKCGKNGVQHAGPTGAALTHALEADKSVCRVGSAYCDCYCY